MTHFTGTDHPDEEVRHNEYRAPERKSKFTAEVAATVKFGDTYLMRRAPGSMRYYVATDDETDADLVCVTHVFKPKWEGSDEGKWQEYDTVGQIVVKINSHDGDPGYAGYRAIESALWHTPLGRAIGVDGMRPLAQELAEKLGLREWGEYESSTQKFTVNVDDEMRVKKALIELLNFKPDYGYDELLGKLGAKVDGVGFAQNGTEYARLLDGETDGFGNEYDKKDRADRVPPVMSQPVFYAVCGGKDQGRSFQRLIDELKAAAGITEADLS